METTPRISEFDIDIVYISAIKSHAADGLSWSNTRDNDERVLNVDLLVFANK